MADSIRMVLGILNTVAAVIWAGAVAYVVYRLYQLCTFRTVAAEVLKAGVDSYLETGEDRDFDGFSRQYSSAVYYAQALVRYEYQGQQYTAVARQDTGTGFRSLHDRLTRKLKPGTRIRVRLHPRKPDQPRLGLGLNLNTFVISIVLAAMGFGFLGMGYAIQRVAALFPKLMGEWPGR